MCWGASVGVAWFYVDSYLQLKIRDETNGSKDVKRDILLFALLAKLLQKEKWQACSL